MIGISSYKNPSYNLRYADKDALAIKSLLLELGIPESNIRVLLDGIATAENIRNGIDWLKAKAKPTDAVIIYYAGHGKDEIGADGTRLGFILPNDGNMTKLVATSIGMREIRDWCLLIRAKHILVLMSCCHAGLAGTARAAPSEIPQDIGKLLSWPSRMLITAGSSGEPDLELDNLKSSPFTYSVVEAIRHATADSNGDGFIIADELYAAIVTKVTARSDGRQHPKYYNLSGDDGQFVFALKPTSPPEGRLSVWQASKDEAVCGRGVCH